MPAIEHDAWVEARHGQLEHFALRELPGHKREGSAGGGRQSGAVDDHGMAPRLRLEIGRRKRCLAQPACGQPGRPRCLQQGAQVHARRVFDPEAVVIGGTRIGSQFAAGVWSPSITRMTKRDPGWWSRNDWAASRASAR